MVFFKDFGKTVNDLFKGDKYKLNRTLKVKAKNDATEWETKTVLTSAGSMSTKLVYKQSDASFGSVELTAPTKGNLEVDYCTPSLTKGLKTNIVVKQPNVDLKGKYENGAFKSKAEARLNADTTTLESIYVDASMGFEGFTVGASGKVKPGDESMLADYNVGIQYAKDPDTTISVATASKCDKVTTSFWRRYSPNAEVAARYTLDLEQPGNPKVEVGGKWKVDSKGTVQGVICTGGEAMFLYKHVLSSRLTASLGAVFDTKSFASDSTTINYQLEFTA